MNAMTVVSTQEQQQATAPAQSFIVKVQYEEDIRRFSFAGTSFAALKEEVCKKYNLKGKAILKYTDDEGDLITVTDDTEFADAVRIALNQGTLKLALSLPKRKFPKDVLMPAVAVAPANTNSAAPTTSGCVAVPCSPSSNTTDPVFNYNAVPIPGQAFPGQSPAPMYVPPFRMMDKHAKMERIQQWREMKRQMCEQKKAAKMEKKVHKQCQKLQKMEVCSQKALARFVKDVGIEDGTELAPNAKFTKTWRFRNEGSAAWPAGSKLIFISLKGGDQMSGPAEVPVPIVALPGTEVDVSIELVAPAAPGRYAGHYRLCSPDGRRFGDRVRNLIYVVDPSSASSSSSDGEVINPQFTAALAQLEQMGFRHRHWNAKLLKKFNGDINKTIHKLVHKQRKYEHKHHKH